MILINLSISTYIRTQGSGPPYPNMPNNGQGMQTHHNNQNSGGNNQMYGGSGGHGHQQPYGGYNNNQGYGPNGSGGSGPSPYGGHGGGAGSGGPQTTESEVFPCSKMYMGRVIGQKGVTVNDVQKRSGCDIQINQDVPPGTDCEITIRGSRQGIEQAKIMLREIIEMGPNHPYAGGRKYILLLFLCFFL